jgi:hypothetical protein
MWCLCVKRKVRFGVFICLLNDIASAPYFNVHFATNTNMSQHIHIGGENSPNTNSTRPGSSFIGQIKSLGGNVSFSQRPQLMK